MEEFLETMKLEKKLSTSRSGWLEGEETSGLVSAEIIGPHGVTHSA